MTHGQMPPEPSWRRLYRNPRRGWIAGVCAGLADYFGVGACLIRAIRDWLIANAPPMAQVFVIEAEGRRDFYRKLGFEPTGKGLQAFVDVWRRA